MCKHRLENEGNILFSRSGGSSEFIDLTQGQIKAIKLIVNTPKNKLDEALIRR